ncbi:MAG: LacI family transcriptional regulator [Oscillospiraceae bacterium]|nr:LacI family transcriptional regulator [Oscillospiraceae bacterium]
MFKLFVPSWNWWFNVITLKDIAKEAGVSITTVSNVVHNKSKRVSPELMEKIQGIITRENYTPSMAARTLANNASPIIGIINHLMTRRSGGFMADPFHNTFINSIEDYVSDKGYFIMVRTVEDSRELRSVYQHWNLAGMIFTGLFYDEFFESVRDIGVPYVLVDSYIDLPEVYSVELEDERGGYLATRHLLEHGHRTIAFASPLISKNNVVDHRLDGYKRALSEFDVPFDPALVFEQDMSVGVGVRFGEGVRLGHRLSKYKDISGIFATADILAAGIMAGLRERGVSIPEDKSIVGFDDNYLCEITYPRLTTIYQDVGKKGIDATRMMISQLQGTPIRNRKVILPVRLVKRDSVKKLS